MAVFTYPIRVTFPGKIIGFISLIFRTKKLEIKVLKSMIIDAMVINNPMVDKSLSLFCKIKSGIAIW